MLTVSLPHAIPPSHSLSLSLFPSPLPAHSLTLTTALPLPFSRYPLPSRPQGDADSDCHKSSGCLGCGGRLSVPEDEPDIECTGSWVSAFEFATQLELRASCLHSPPLCLGNRTPGGIPGSGPRCVEEAGSLCSAGVVSLRLRHEKRRCSDSRAARYSDPVLQVLKEVQRSLLGNSVPGTAGELNLLAPFSESG
eukprot:3941059-Rhodomonas_salina.4